MDVQVKVNGTDRSSYVVSYEREHKICTGIGRLLIVFEQNVPETFVPWDEISIYEEGDFKVKYYVSSVEDSDPSSTITLDCQDNSKRLVDYFIPDQYTVEEPTYTRYWIEKFLDEAGINYQFDTTSQGSLISNYTSLGLQSAYEQIIVLLQMSGWYIFFDGNGVAIIGNLNKNLSPVDETLGRDDILEIMLKKDDRMLRNRALVLGNYDPFTLTRVKADVTVKTKWNYDSSDIRTMVVSNSNIPNNSSAYGIANTLIKEFAKITVEKHLTAHGARDLVLGDVVMVQSTVYFGKGVITTFGVRMSKEGLVTDLVLDERCPRLLGFFNFGDYVYVGTYGDGVWRKHIKFIHDWHDFSAGLVDQRATDLHVNHGVFTCVTASGDMHYTLTDDGPWIHIATPESLESSLNEVVTSGDVGLAPFSGIMARATMVDKESNRIIYGVDTWSGLNMGDYFMDLSGWSVSSPIESGITVMSGYRGWVLEYHPASGMGSYNAFPINVSGNYNIRVVDIENDGFYDYVSVGMGGGTTISGDSSLQEYTYGYGGTTEYRDTSYVSLSNLDDVQNTSLNSSFASSAFNVFCIGMVDNYQDHEFFLAKHIFGAYSFQILKFANNNVVGIDILTNTTVTLTNMVPYSMNARSHGSQITRIGTDTYRFLAQLNTGKMAIVTVTHLGAESYTVSTLDIDESDSEKSFYVASQNDENLLLVYRNPDFVLGNNQKVWFQNINLETMSIGNAVLAHDSGGTAAFPTRLYFVVMGYGEGFQLIGWQLMWDAAAPAFEAHPVYSLGGPLVVGGTQFISSGAIDILSQATHRLSRTWGTARHTEGSTTYVNYGIQGTTSFVHSPANDVVWGLCPIVNPEFDERAFRIQTTSQTGGTWGQLQYSDLPITTWTNIDLGDYAPMSSLFFRADSITGNIYLMGRHKVDGGNFLIAINPDSLTLVSAVEAPISSFAINQADPAGRHMFNIGNIIVSVFPNFTNSLGVEFRVWENFEPPLGEGTGFLVLRREGYEFDVIQRAALPIRIDISNFNPLLTVQSGVNSFESYSIYGDEVLQTSMPDSVPGGVNDYRYTFLPGSGQLAVSKLGLYVTISGDEINSFDTDTMSGLEVLYEDIAGSGTLSRIETSNYAPSGQYIFVTTSGSNPEFYQLDPGQVTFSPYPGLPESRATIIRLDDRL